MIRSAVKAVLAHREHKPMRYFAYNDFGEDGEPVVTVKSEKQILDEYWELWVRMMETRYNFTPQETKMLKHDECIEYWTAFNWAWPVDENGKTLESEE